MDFYTGDAQLTPRQLSVLVHHLPPGCPLWRAVGGQRAWSDEMHLLAGIELGVRVLDWRQTEAGRKNQKQPVPIEPPPLAHEADAADDRLERKILQHAQRQRQRQIDSP